MNNVKAWRKKVHVQITEHVHAGDTISNIRNWVHDLADDLMDQIEAIIASQETKRQ